jgi:hypothetical protein
MLARAKDCSYPAISLWSFPSAALRAGGARRTQSPTLVGIAAFSACLIFSGRAQSSVNARSANDKPAGGNAMPASKKQGNKGQQQLADVKKRLREGKLTKADIKALEKIVIVAENAAKALRAAIVE